MLGGIIENLLVMFATIIVMVVGGWLFLLFLQLLLRLKAGRREEEGLADLWQTIVIKPDNAENSDDPGIPPVSQN